jgi:hypothetical protein
MRALVALSVAALTLGTTIASANPAHHARPATSAEAVGPRGMGLMRMT